LAREVVGLPPGPSQGEKQKLIDGQLFQRAHFSNRQGNFAGVLLKGFQGDFHYGLKNVECGIKNPQSF
jgi:hypothetical protein